MSLVERGAEDPAGPLPPLAPPVRGRGQAWLLTAAVGLLVLVYLVAWAGYATVHQGSRYRQLAPGAMATVDEGTTRLLSLTRTERVLNQSGDAAVADAGTTYVIAELEFTRSHPSEYGTCLETLIGPGGRTWDPSGPGVDRAVHDCESEDAKVGQPYRYEEIYQVPLPYADQIYGVTVPDSTSSRRTQVLRPGA